LGRSKAVSRSATIWSCKRLWSMEQPTSETLKNEYRRPGPYRTSPRLQGSSAHLLARNCIAE
jgi:hypothetical protein